jgi:acyl-coenzyme A synthetase/AMP-(fatty) acid ligase
VGPRGPVADDQGWFQTSDPGAIVDGEVGIVGRLDDVIVTSARNISAEFVEEAIASTKGVRHRTCACSLPDGRWAIVAEVATSTPSETERVLTNLRAAAVRACGSSPDIVMAVSRGQLPVTTSGKNRRRELASRIFSGELQAVLQLDE